MQQKGKEKMKLVDVSLQEFGAYFIYELEVQRGIRGKTKGKVNELLIVGIPKQKLHQYCLDKGIWIANEKGEILYGEKI